MQLIKDPLDESKSSSSELFLKENSILEKSMRDLKPEDENSQDEAKEAPANKASMEIKIRSEATTNTNPPTRDDIIEVLINDPADAKYTPLGVNADLSKKWAQWMANGLSDESKRDIINKYGRKRYLYTQAPQINLEIVSARTEIAKKKRQTLWRSFINGDRTSGRRNR